jgi:hypothetical protein
VFYLATARIYQDEIYILQSSNVLFLTCAILALYEFMMNMSQNFLNNTGLSALEDVDLSATMSRLEKIPPDLHPFRHQAPLLATDLV